MSTEPLTTGRRVGDRVVRVRTALQLLPRALGLAFLWLWAGFSIFAFLWVVFASLKTTQGFFAGVWSLPSKLHFENYVRALTGSGLGIAILNSLLVVAVSVVLLNVLAAPAAYTLTRVRFPGAQLIQNLFILGIGVPAQVIIIPLFFLMNDFHLVDSLVGLIIAEVVTSLPFTVFFLTGFFRSLPGVLEEAATIDGCTRFQTFFRIMLPLAVPGMITVTIFNVVFLLNEFLLALTLISSNSKYTLALGLFALYGNMRYTGDWVGLFAGFSVVMLPSLLVYLFLSTRIMEGLTMGATKG